MIVIALDDEKMPLEVLVEAFHEVYPNEEIHAFTNPGDALSLAKDVKIDIAFLDIRMRGITGISVAKMLKKSNPRTNVIFVTGYDEYREQAFDQHASGYLLKPVTPEAIKKEVEDLRYPISVEEESKNSTTSSSNKRIKAKTFGNFDLYVDGKAVEFSRTLSKELLAYLVDKHGAQVSRQEISLLLFGDEEYSRKTQDYLSKIFKSLIDSLKAVHAEEIIIKGHNAYSVDVEKFDCDAYSYLKGDAKAINSFLGEYMSQYLWSEESIDKFYR